MKKEMLIERFRQINDKNLIEAIQNLLDFAAKKEEEKYAVPEVHQKIVKERFEKVRKEPERLLDWDQAKEKLKA